MKINLNCVFVLLVCLMGVSHLKAQTNYGSIRGKITDPEGNSIIGATIQLMSNDSSEIYETKKSEGNGFYNFINLSPGVYSIRIVKEGFENQIISSVSVATNQEAWISVIIYLKTYILDPKGSKTKHIKEEKPITRIPLIPSITGIEIIKAGARSPLLFVSLKPGVSLGRSGISGRGSRADGTVFFIDGVRVLNYNMAQSAQAYVDVLQGGIPAMYGDFTGLGVVVTTKGSLSAKRGKSIDLFTSSLFNPYHSNLVEFNYFSPILFRKNPYYDPSDLYSIRKIPTAAMSLSGTFSYQKDAPSFVKYTVVKKDVLNELEKNPLVTNKDGGFVHAANYLTEDDFDRVKVRPNTHSIAATSQAKFVFRLNDLANLTVFGNFVYNNNLGGGNNILAYRSNPQNIQYYTMAYAKYTQKFKEPSQERKENETTLNNTFIEVRADYQSIWRRNFDPNFKDDIFSYGYLGQFKHYPVEFYQYYGNINNPNQTPRKMVDQNGDTVYLRNFWEQTGFRDSAIRFSQANINRVRGNYTQAVFDLYERNGNPMTNDLQILLNQGLLNGYNPSNIYSLWNSPGTMLSGYGKSQQERFTLFAMGETVVKKPVRLNNEDAGHSLQFGLTYEQEISRNYFIRANDMWRLMYQLSNSHIAELDKSKPILSYDKDGVFLDTVRYNRLINYNSQTHFDKAFRDKLIKEGALDIYGKPINQQTFIDINSYKPSDFSIEMFSADELLNNGNSYVNYNGYDHKGNKIRRRPSVNDFLLDKNKRAIGAFAPVYTSVWLQDNFKFKNLEFRVGLRIERYDANQLILKDPYSLYPIRTVGEISNLGGNEINHPSNIGKDYAVYVDNTLNPTQILGYRNGDKWFDKEGNQVSSSDYIANKTINGRIQPLLVDPNNQKLTENSFKDYQAKINVLPRIFFKFPLNSRSMFYASYDILSQRPNNNLITIDDYYFMEQKNSGNLANPALNSRLTNDYQIGYKQQLNKNTMLHLNAYYRETKGDMSLFQYTNAYPITYISYANIDFSTVKGLTMDLNYQAINNISLGANYTLQFADGTGANIDAQRALIASNQPNLRTLFPMGEYDIRHQIKGVFNWEFFNSKNPNSKLYYNGPIIAKKMLLKNTNINFTYSATSGLPYTATSQPVQLGSVDRSPIKGSPWGSRLPWQFNSTMNITKSFPIITKDKTGKNKSNMLIVYYNVTNLFNQKIINNVWSYTGSTETDGFLNSPRGEQATQQQLSAESYNFYYNTLVNNPNLLQAPRFSRLGVKYMF